MRWVVHFARFVQLLHGFLQIGLILPGAWIAGVVRFLRTVSLTTRSGIFRHTFRLFE